MKKVLMGNHAAAMAAVLARVEVATAYPITPQTQAVELLAELHAKGEYKGRLIKVESEHSAMAALLGAATAGARTFTCTSSQGLAYMHELLHWVSGARLPVVMVDVNRALAAPWNLWTDQTDSLSQRDTGWMQFYCSTNQEVLDAVLMAYKVAEEVSLPAMVVLDGFTLSHTYEPVDVPDQALVDRFLPPWRPAETLDWTKPLTFGALVQPKGYFRLRQKMAVDMRRAEDAAERAGRDFGELFGRPYGLVEPYLCDDADVVLVTSGAVASTAMAAVDALRALGLPAGNLRMRAFRPFPAQALRRALKPGQRLVVIDRNYSPGGTGIFYEEIKAALYTEPQRREVHGVIAGLGGGDITPELLQEIWRQTFERRVDLEEPAWMEEAR